MLRLNVGSVVKKGFLKEKALELKNILGQNEKQVGGKKNPIQKWVYYVRNWGDGHEAEMNMQSLTSEGPKNQAEKCKTFQTGVGASLKDTGQHILF